MIDLISRKAMIDAVKNELDKTDQSDAEKTLNLFYWQVLIRSVSSANQWIPCSEKLPKLDEECLVTEEGGYIRHCIFDCYNDVPVFLTYDNRLTVPDVIAWMPLPEPYKEE